MKFKEIPTIITETASPYAGLKVEQLPVDVQAAVKILAVLQVRGVMDYAILRGALTPCFRPYLREMLAVLMGGGYVVARWRDATKDSPYRTVYELGNGLPDWIDRELFERVVTRLKVSPQKGGRKSVEQ